MAFEALETVRKIAYRQTLASVGYKRNRNGKHNRAPRLTIGIPSAIAKMAKIKPDQLFTLLVGTGPDSGKARIVPTNAGGVLPRNIRGGLTFAFGYVPMLGEDAAEKEFVEARALNDIDHGGAGGFEIWLPAWFKADDHES